MKKIIFFILLLAAFSCVSTSKWREKYAEKKFFPLVSKYQSPTDTTLTFASLQGDLYKNPRLSTRKEIKKQYFYMEKGLALHPDSVQTRSDKTIDSFYTNPNKIAFIKKHKLKGKNMYFR